MCLDEWNHCWNKSRPRKFAPEGRRKAGERARGSGGSEKRGAAGASSLDSVDPSELGEAGLSLSSVLQHQGLAFLFWVSEWSAYQGCYAGALPSLQVNTGIQGFFLTLELDVFQVSEKLVTVLSAKESILEADNPPASQIPMEDLFLRRSALRVVRHWR
ncbi:hypothetical protein STEG23_030005, partial [Scotinomys teguina]